MTLGIKLFVLGPLENNSYLLSDEETGNAVIIDPSFYSHHILDYAVENHLHIIGAWITHAHFDHYAGIPYLFKQLTPNFEILLHCEDLELWKRGGEAPAGLGISPEILPTQLIDDRQTVTLGTHVFQVLHTPGHTRGHITFFHAQTDSAFCGDVIFQNSIGRTDLYGGDYHLLISSIRNRILTLPPQTRLFSGHGESTTVQAELVNNPFLKV